jgi:hypothetical protein
MCMGIPEGRVRSMGGSHMGKVMSDYFKIKINGSDHGQNIFVGRQFSFSSLTS